jgi:hypothetical protein
LAPLLTDAMHKKYVSDHNRNLTHLVDTKCQ